MQWGSTSLSRHGQVALDSPSRKVEDALQNELVAGPDAVRTENAGLGVFVGQCAAEARLGHSALRRHLTDDRDVRPAAEVHLRQNFPMLPDILTLRLHLHVIPDGIVAGGHQALAPPRLHFADAQTAIPAGGEVFMVTQGGDLESRLLHRSQQE